jgi:hypothetical protein
MIEIREENNKLLVYQDDKLIAEDKDVGLFITNKERKLTYLTVSTIFKWAEFVKDKLYKPVRFFFYNCFYFSS